MIDLVSVWIGINIGGDIHHLSYPGPYGTRSWEG